MRLPRLVRQAMPLPGVRLRSALAAGTVVAVVAVLAGAVLLFVARGILLNNVNAVANDRAAQLVTALSTGDQDAVASALRPSARDRTVVQILDAGGRIAAASTAITGEPPMSALRPAAGTRLRAQQPLPAAGDETFQILAGGVNTPTGLQTVLVAVSLDTVVDATEAILAALLVGLPVLALMVGVATFVFVGRSLRPVEAMRRRATTITATNLHARLPVPAADDEIAALARTMNTMLARIEAATDTQRRFVADASHELRSPLATIHANADLLDTAALPDDSRGPVRRIHHESRRMARLVDDLLLLARFDDRAVRLRLGEVDLDDLVYAARERIAVQHPTIHVDIHVTPVRVTGDPDQLHRVLRNLVDNAARHATQTVTLTCEPAGHEALLIVGNDGPAIAPADRTRIFDRFVRLDDSRARAGGGAGLGLAIVRDIVAAHGGTVEAVDLSSGAAFRIRLPVALHHR